MAGDNPKAFKEEPTPIDQPVDKEAAAAMQQVACETGGRAGQLTPPSAMRNPGPASHSASDNDAREVVGRQIPGQLDIPNTRSDRSGNGQFQDLPESCPLVDCDTGSPQEVRVFTVNDPGPFAAQGGIAGHSSQVSDTANELPDSSPEIDTEHPGGDDVEHDGPRKHKKKWHPLNSKRPKNEGWDMRVILQNLCGVVTLPGTHFAVYMYMYIVLYVH